ncbi:LacI family DNA-binding transcriptional regulator [Roseobacteraceae bacterium S113]
MRDVARAVGVSPMTVSRALRDDQTVNQATRDKIRSVAQDLGYVYDTTAQAFRRQKSGFVAVTMPSLNNANFAQTFRGLSDRLGESGIQLLLGSTSYSVEREEALVNQLLTRNPEALVMTGGHHTEEVRAMIRARGLPVIETWDLPPEPLGHVVGFSNADAAALLVHHLADTGRRKLLFVGAQDGADYRGMARRAGVMRAAQDLGLPQVDILEAGPAPVSMRHGNAALERFGMAVGKYDAIVCVSDPVAFGCLSACQRLGLSVPGDLAITGFGNFEVAQISHPKITTVAVSAEEIGHHVAGLLEQIFEHDAVAPQTIEVDVALKPGGTT